MTRAPAVQNQQKDFPTLLESSKGEIAKMLPEGMSVDRVARVALTAWRLSPEIQKCSPVSILSSVMKACELGLEPGGALRHAWLVPYNGACSFQLSYFGLLELARRSGELLVADARIVGEADMFALEYTPDPVFVHRPSFSLPNEPRLVYAYAKLNNGETVFEVMTHAEIERLRQESKAGPVWKKYWGEMARKTVLKRLLKKQRLSIEVAAAIDYDYGQEAGPARVIHEQPGISRSQQLAAQLRGAIEPPPVAEADADEEDFEPIGREPGEEG